jgi:aryl-alcohol dehydrogenase-like predicted oxidoreductase
MKYIDVESLNLRVPQLALGVNKTGCRLNGNTDTEKNRIIFYHKAMSLGVNLFDTAELYGGGYSEEILGKALFDRRSEAIICSKFNARNSERDFLRTSLENSLKRLKTDYIDFYLSHWLNPNIPLDELIDSLEVFKKEGKIRAFGIGNASFSEICNFNKKNNNNFFVVENEYNLLERDAEEEIIPYCSKNNCLFMAYSPFLQGKRVVFEDKFNLLKEKHNCTTQQLLLSWACKDNIISVVRTLNLNHLRDNVQSLNIELSKEDVKNIEGSLGVKRHFINIDQVKIDNRVYSSFQEAVDNKLDLIPSPALLSDRLKNKFELSPLRTIYKDGKYEILNDYYFSEIKKYWAWKFCNREKIEVYVFDEIS